MIWGFTVTTRTLTLFEGTSEIQRLVMSRAISGNHVD